MRINVAIGGAWVVVWISGCLTLAVGCQREERRLYVEPRAADLVQASRSSGLYPGPGGHDILTNLFSTNKAAYKSITNILARSTNETITGVQWRDPTLGAFYWENAYGMAEGKRLYIYFNCVGCHGHGGGGMGPPLMDLEWRYGGELPDIFASIVQGRPNGMPAFKDRIPEYMVWQLAAYVRSMSGVARKDVAPARSDHIWARPPENTIDPRTRKEVGK